MTRTPTGRIEVVDGEHRLVIVRELRAPIEDVWAAVTESERLARWIGTFTGDPASGLVRFRMTVEEGAPEDDMEIRECDPPHRLAVTARSGDEGWRLELDLVERGGLTVLTFTQPGIDPASVDSVGPGWEYYLDRLVAAEAGDDPGELDFGRDYYPAMAEHYRTGRI